MTKYFQEIQEELEYERNPFAYYPEGEETSLFPPIEEKRTEKPKEEKEKSYLGEYITAGTTLLEVIRRGLETFL